SGELLRLHQDPQAFLPALRRCRLRPRIAHDQGFRDRRAAVLQAARSHGSPNCWKCTASLGSISIRMPGSNIHEIGLRWGNEHEGIVGKLSKKNGKSCTNTAIGSTAGGPQTRERNLKSPGAAPAPRTLAPGPGAVESQSRNSAAHFQAAQTKAENARE